MTEFITAPTAAKLMKVHSDTIKRWCLKEGSGIRFDILPCGTWAIDKESLLVYAASPRKITDNSWNQPRKAGNSQNAAMLAAIEKRAAAQAALLERIKALKTA